MQLIESCKLIGSSPVRRTSRVLVVDGDPFTCAALRETLDSNFVVDHGQEVEEAEALVSQRLYSVVVIRACTVGSDRRRQLDFVRFVGLQSKRTRVILLDQPGRFADDDRTLPLAVDLVLPQEPRSCTMALLVAEIAVAT